MTFLLMVCKHFLGSYPVAMRLSSQAAGPQASRGNGDEFFCFDCMRLRHC